MGKSKAQNVLNIHPLKSSGPKGYVIREMNKLISNEGDLHEANNVKETVEGIMGALEAIEQLGGKKIYIIMYMLREILYELFLF